MKYTKNKGTPQEIKKRVNVKNFSLVSILTGQIQKIGNRYSVPGWGEVVIKGFRSIGGELIITFAGKPQTIAPDLIGLKWVNTTLKDLNQVSPMNRHAVWGFAKNTMSEHEYQIEIEPGDDPTTTDIVTNIISEEIKRLRIHHYKITQVYETETPHNYIYHLKSTKAGIEKYNKFYNEYYGEETS